MKIERNVAERALKRKGFVRRGRKGEDHIYYHFEFEGCDPHIITFFSRSRKEKTIGGYLFNQMQKQLRLDNPKEAYDLLACPMGKEEYIQKLKLKGELE